MTTTTKTNRTTTGGLRPPRTPQQRVQKTHATKIGEVERRWRVVDADGMTLGRISTRIATLLRGKHKTMFTPGLDTGDPVIVLNAGKIRVTGKKLSDKVYVRHSNYPGGFRSETLESLLARRPTEVIRHSVRGMLPRNRLGEQMMRKLFIYAGADHPHAAQKPEALEEASR